MNKKIEPHIKAYCGHIICKNWKNCTTCDMCNCDCIMAKCYHEKNDKCNQSFVQLPCNHYIIEHCDCEITLTEFLAFELH